ncbi:NTP transferase domain-containing protein [Candidatus Peregrinibacteria bacterium]|nr:NTP transferase domain-containing protein [Candidatus Peregrinibacteria bacterium]
MKGIILAGGEGNRLKPLTEYTNKHLLHIYNQPMVYYPLNTLTNAGIREILIVTGPKHAGTFLQLLGDGRRFKCNLQFRVQEKAEGIAHALSLSKKFVGNDSCAVILGDNIFEDDLTKEIKAFTGSGAHIFLKETESPQRFGVAELKGKNVVKIEEKPKNPKSNYAVTGLYLFDPNVFEIINGLRPSNRGEYEITDVNNEYIKRGQLTATLLKKRWTDSGTFESLYRANHIAREIHLRKNYGARAHSKISDTKKDPALEFMTKTQLQNLET